MKAVKVLDRIARALLGIALGVWLVCPGTAGAALEQAFDVLQVGTTTYRNVTVTTKNKNYVFILHSKGMTNIKVADLSSDLRTKLGYEDPDAAHVKTNSPARWAKQALSKLEVPQVNKIREQLAGWGLPTQAATKLRVPAMSQKILVLSVAVLFGLYLFHCYCCLAICRKCGGEPGPLIWVPLFQLFPLLKAASMPPWWFVVFLIPGVNLIAQVIWFIKITQARGKGFGVALLLIFPLTSPFAALYLAFSGGRSARKEAPRRIEIMSLETA